MVESKGYLAQVSVLVAVVVAVTTPIVPTNGTQLFSDVAGGEENLPTDLPVSAVHASTILTLVGEFSTPLLETFPYWVPQDQCSNIPKRDPDFVPIDPSYDPRNALPTNPPVSRDDLFGGPAPFAIFRNIQMPAFAGMTTTNEPSLGSSRNVVFYTGNRYAAISRDAGITWQYINPTGFSQPTGAGPFCCDQIVIYDPGQDVMVWLLQYQRDGNGHNVQRIAVTTAIQSAQGNINWKLYEIRPETFGSPTANHWLDFPDLAYTDTFLYMTTRVFNANSPVANVTLRIRLGDLRNQLDPIGIAYFRYTTGQSWRMAQGGRANMLFGQLETNTKFRVFIWPDISPTVSTGVLTHAGFQIGGFSLPPGGGPPDGSNVAFDADNRALGAYFIQEGGAGAFTGFMFMVGRDTNPGGYPYPYTRVLGSRLSSIIVGGETPAELQMSIWNPQWASLFPSCYPNLRGDLGGTITYGGNFYPEARAWISDGGDLANIFESRLLTAGTTGQPAGSRWGDYFTTRRNWLVPNTWVAGNYIQTGAGIGAGRPLYAWFGREPDRPPADLHVQSVATPPGAYSASQAIQLTAGILNIGAQNSLLGSVEFRATGDTTVNANDPLLGTQILGALIPEAGENPAVQGTVPDGLIGSYLIGVIANTGNEGYPGNNTGVSSERVVIGLMVAVSPDKNTLSWNPQLQATSYDVMTRRILNTHTGVPFDGNFTFFVKPSTQPPCLSGCQQAGNSYDIGCRGAPPVGGLDMWIVRYRGQLPMTWNEGGNQVASRDPQVPNPCP